MNIYIDMKLYAIHRKNGHYIEYNYKVCSTREVAESYYKKFMDLYMQRNPKNFDPKACWIEEVKVLTD